MPLRVILQTGASLKRACNPVSIRAPQALIWAPRSIQPLQVRERVVKKPISGIV